MGEGSWRSATVAELCARAGLHKRYFYESFTDLDGVARGVIDLVAEAIASAALTTYLALPENTPLEEQAKSTLDVVIRVLVEDPRKAQTLFGPVSASLDLLEHRTLALSGLTAVLTEHARTIHDVELEADSLAAVAPAFLVGGTGEAVLSWLRNPERSTIDQLVDDITVLWLITGNGAAEAARHRMGL
jgi:AcrR family transcriptional regulator